MSNANKTREFRVEAHGQSVLVVIGGGASPVNAFVREPLLTREGAWSTVRALASGSAAYHTLKVYQAGKLVFRAFRQLDGTFIDAATCKTVAA